MDTKKHSVFKIQFFDFEKVDENNEKSWELYNRLASTGDERSKAIFAGIIVEYYLDRLLKLLFVDYSVLEDRIDYTFSLKISLLRSLRLIPENIINMCDCVRKVRNEFAHNLDKDNIQKINIKIKTRINQLFTENSDIKEEVELIKKFEIIYRLGSSYLRSYEKNVRLLREKMDDHSFIEELRILNEKRMFEMQEKIISNGPIKVIDRGDNIEEVYPQNLHVLKKKKSSIRGRPIKP